MPVKVHVKGKRKAPLPPNTSIKPNATVASNDANISPAASPIENVKKKSPAPQPPPSVASASTASQQLGAIKHLDIVRKIEMNIEPNNLSTVGNKQTDKMYETKTIFNIVEPKHIRNNLRTAAYRSDEPILTKFTSDCVNVYNNNDGADGGTKEVWNCEYCTLENPFWKIVCAACDRIRPYGLPTRTVPNNKSNVLSAHTNDAMPSTSDVNIAEVQLRRKPSINGNNLDTISSKRSSIDGDIQPYAVGPAPIELTQKIDNKNSAKKRASMIVTKDRDYTMNTLEMEKQRLRAVIRSMNSRAMAEKYPMDKPNNIDMAAAVHRYETLNLNVNGMEKNREKELNGERYVLYDALRLTDDAKAKANGEKNSSMRADGRNAVKAKADDTCYDFVGNLATFCDQELPGGTMRRLEADIMQKKPKKNEPNEATNLRFIDEMPAFDLVINLYVNFNNAIGVDVRRNMTLKELKEYISAHIVPCRNPKIYFNGLLMQKDQTLVEYGIKDRSSLYINTENITVDVDNVHRNLKHSKNENPTLNGEVVAAATVQPKHNAMKNEPKQNPPDAAGTQQFEFPKENDYQPAKYQIEHIQLNRFTIEKINPEKTNITRTKYRGVYNYNPRCNPNVILEPKTDLGHVADAKQKQAVTTIANLSMEKSPATTTTTKKMKEASNHYMELLSLDDLNDVAVNADAFECAVCFVDYEPTEGVVLRNCLHTFCKECIRNTIIYSEEAEVKCPYIDAKYTCECTLQDREIKALLTKAEHDEHLAKSLRVAENQIENSFHCRTPNCAGWCIYEDNVNQYKCAICSLVNCLTCRVIHDGLDCAQYQETVKNNLEGNPENAITKNMLDEIIKNGEAMNCPTCRVVLMKKWGCDWLKCSMCKTEICWVTRGSRWGPAGKGDTTGGCKCGVDGFKCHPKCNYCH